MHFMYYKPGHYFMHFMYYKPGHYFMHFMYYKPVIRTEKCPDLCFPLIMYFDEIWFSRLMDKIDHGDYIHYHKL